MSSDNSEALPEGHVSVNATVFVHDSSQPWAQAFPLSTTVAAVLDEIVAKFSIPEPATCGLYSPATDSEPECWLTTSETLATYKTVCVWLELRCNRWLSVSADLLLAVCVSVCIHSDSTCWSTNSCLGKRKSHYQAKPWFPLSWIRMLHVSQRAWHLFKPTHSTQARIIVSSCLLLME
jgi:hypothetical protein